MVVSLPRFTACAKDSGKKHTRLVFLAGYVAESAAWTVFQKKWNIKLKKYGIVGFRRSTYDVKKHGNQLLIEFADLIHDYVNLGFACGIDCDDWREIAKEYALVLYHIMPYSACARICIRLVREWCAINKVKSDQMVYLFDKSSEDAGELVDLLKIDKSEDARKTLPSLATGDFKEVAGLQAPDFLAWEIRNQFLTNPDPQGWDDLAPELARLLRQPPFELNQVGKIPKFGYYRRRDLAKLCKRAKIPLIKDVPEEVWNMAKPIRLNWPLRRP